MQIGQGQLVYDPETGQMIDRYESRMKKMSAQRGLQSEVDSGGLDMSQYDASSEGPGVVESGKVNQVDFKKAANPGMEFDSEGSLLVDEAAGDGVGKQPASGAMGGMQGVDAAMKTKGGGMSKAGAGMMAMGGATANPYLVGAGLAVGAAGSITDGKREAEKNRYLAEVQKFNARQNAYQKLADLGTQLKA